MVLERKLAITKPVMLDRLRRHNVQERRIADLAVQQLVTRIIIKTDVLVPHVMWHLIILVQ